MGKATHPAPAGIPSVLYALKDYVGVAVAERAPVETRVIGPDLYPLRADSPLKAEHELLSELFVEAVGSPAYHLPHFQITTTGKKILALDEVATGRVLLAAAE